MKDRRIGGALAVAGVSLLCTIHGNATLAPWPTYRDAAIDAAKWIHAARIETPGGKGLRWVQAEHRVRPELLVAQTGYMQGAAGSAFVRFPDTPWPQP
jgi:hypothetical protein